MIAAATQLVTAVLGAGYMSKAETELDLASITETQLNATTPALLCSVPGYDASGQFSHSSNSHIHIPESTCYSLLKLSGATSTLSKTPSHFSRCRN